MVDCEPRRLQRKDNIIRGQGRFLSVTSNTHLDSVSLNLTGGGCVAGDYDKVLMVPNPCKLLPRRPDAQNVVVPTGILLI